MSTDYAGKEREFLDSLEADTGRDLAGWMRAIDESGQASRNDIIDWLRLQGFLFARASWMERIHNNGGRPLYGDKPAGRQVLPARRARQPERPAPERSAAASVPEPLPPARAKPEPAPSPPPPAAPPAALVREPVAAPPPPRPIAQQSEPPKVAAPSPPSPPPQAAAAPAGTGDETVDAVIARAKGLRPLAQYLLREVEKAVPGTMVAAHGDSLALSRPLAYAMIVVSPRDLRLLLDFGGGAPPDGVVPARVPGIDARFRHMLVLSDARQLNAALAALLQVADATVNGRSAAAAG